MNKRKAKEAVGLAFSLVLFAVLSLYFNYPIIAGIAAILAFVLFCLSFLTRDASGKTRGLHTSTPRTRLQQVKRLTRETALKVHDFDTLSGEAFEDLLRFYFEDQGYKVETTPKTGDFGVDLILTHPKENYKIAVQAKRWKRAVNLEAVQQVIGGKRHYNCLDAWVITSGTFEQSAMTLAESTNVTLMNGLIIGQKIKNWQKKNGVDVDRLKPVRQQTERKPLPPKCDLCGGLMVKRKGKYGEFWGCEDYPKCKNTKKLSEVGS